MIFELALQICCTPICRHWDYFVIYTPALNLDTVETCSYAIFFVSMNNYTISGYCDIICFHSIAKEYVFSLTFIKTSKT